MIRSSTDPPDSSGATSVFADFLRRLEAGEEVGLDALCDRHPDIAEQLRALNDDYRRQDFLKKGLSTVRAPGLLREVVTPARISSTSDGLRPSTAAFIAQLEAHAPAGSRYAVGERITRGGQGELLEVRDEDLGRTLVMKQIRPDHLARCRLEDPDLIDGIVSQFLDEARVTSHLNHPGIIPIHDVGLTDSGNVYFMMPKVEGKTLGEIIKQVRKGSKEWTRTRALGVILRVCETMAYAHAQGLLHRDLKPANIMVGAFGETYVMDWGLARPLDQFGARQRQDDRRHASRAGHTHAQRPLSRPPPKQRHPGSAQQGDSAGDALADTVITREPGTIPYMAPEQAAGRRDLMGPHTDVYAVGAILYELLTGYPPHRHSGSPTPENADAARLQVIRSAPEPIARHRRGEIPDELIAICEKAMARSTRNRYRTMSALAGDLRAYLEGRVVAAFESGPIAQLRKWMARNKAITLSAAVTILAITVGFAVSSVQLARYRRVVAERDGEIALRKSAEFELALGAAELARQRGAWPKVIEYVDRAAALGNLDPVATGMRRAEALAAMSRNREAAAILNGLLKRSDLGSRKGRVLLALGECRTADTATPEAYDKLVRSALDTGLEGADREYAQGQLDPRAEGALAHYRKALVLDPFHFQARRDMIGLCLALGRWDEAERQAEVLHLLFPEDPTDHIVRLERALAERSFEEARSHLGGLTEKIPKAVLDQCRNAIAQQEALNGVSIQDNGFLSGVSLEDLQIAYTMRRALARWIPVHPAVDASFRETLGALQCSLMGDWSGAQTHARRALDHAPNAVAGYVLATALFMHRDTGRFPDERSWLSEVADLFGEAASIPAPMTPVVEKSLLFWEIKTRVLLATERGVSSQRRRAIEQLRAFSRRNDLQPAELKRASKFALELRDAPLARRLVERWEDLAPDDPVMRRHKARVAMSAHNYIEAADLLWNLLGDSPTDEDLNRSYADAVKKAQDWVKVADNEG